LKWYDAGIVGVCSTEQFAGIKAGLLALTSFYQFLQWCTSIIYRNV